MRVALPRAAVPRRGPQEILLEVREDRPPRPHGRGPRLAAPRAARQSLLPLPADSHAGRAAPLRGGGPGNHRVAYALSSDGGSTFGPIQNHPDLLPPVCQASAVEYKGSLYFAGPHSTTARMNMTVLALSLLHLPEPTRPD